MEIYRSRDGHWLVEHSAGVYWVYDLTISDDEEAWSCVTMDQLLSWLTCRGVRVVDLVEIDPGPGRSLSHGDRPAPGRA